ncbi:MAG: hypothetical protein HY055_03330 [Magnetospirillum sp.]|nr:hypothetical protein [Magnetospirillum sp.]
MPIRETHIIRPGHYGPIRLRAVVIGVLAATLLDGDTAWRVSHLKTGKSIPALFPSRRDAIRCARQLEKMANWGSVEQIATTRERDDLWWRIRPIMVGNRAVVSTATDYARRVIRSDVGSESAQ